MFAVLRIAGPKILTAMEKIITSYLTSFSNVDNVSGQTMMHYIKNVCIQSLELIVPIGLLTIAFAVIFTAAQTKLLFSVKSLKPKFSRMNPISGFKKLISLRSLVELIKSAVKIVIVLFILYSQIKSQMHAVMSMSEVGVGQGIIWTFETAFNIAIRIGLWMVLFGIIDYFYQWWDFEKQMKMTKQELKEEFKQTEGNPQTKGRIRDIQRRMSVARMMQQVPLADVVIKNPTHFAVALRYDKKKDRAPVVLAKGQDFLALKIIEIAEENDVSVIENRPLARGLYEATELNQEIPEEFYQAVADVLVYIYNLKRKGRKKR